jgi:hypothetical protein
MARIGILDSTNIGIDGGVRGNWEMKGFEKLCYANFAELWGSAGC